MGSGVGKLNHAAEPYESEINEVFIRAQALRIGISHKGWFCLGLASTFTLF